MLEQTCELLPGGFRPAHADSAVSYLHQRDPQLVFRPFGVSQTSGNGMEREKVFAQMPGEKKRPMMLLIRAKLSLFTE